MPYLKTFKQLHVTCVLATLTPAQIWNILSVHLQSQVVQDGGAGWCLASMPWRISDLCALTLATVTAASLTEDVVTVHKQQ